MAQAGKSLVIKVGTNGIAFNAVDELNSASMSANGENLDITAFGDSYRDRIQGLKDVGYSLGGFYDSGDTNGQTVIRAAWAGDTALYIQFLVDGTNGWQQQVKVSGFNISAAVDGLVELAIDLEGAGAVTVIP